MFESNIAAQVLLDFVFNTRENIFLTGKAGTGKTTLLHYIHQNCKKNLITLAPTGVAAINARGVTIHSFFQLPFIPFVPNKNFQYSDNANNTHQLLSKLRYNKNLIQSIQKLDLIIIDEISMVRADVMDEIDVILKYYRNNDEPFGGVQMLCIGDVYQLPPVCKDAEWNVMSNYYSSIYFFDSEVLRINPLLLIELEHIYRQNDEEFLNILNSIRNAELEDYHSEILHQRFNPNYAPKDDESCITLTTHNVKANSINESKLNEINASVFSFRAEVKGDFPEHIFPCEHELKLKKGAQVMFLRNDVDKAYYNGKIGTIYSINNEEIIVQSTEDEHLITVKKEIWENIKYTNNDNKIEQEIIGTFSQFPLRLAWAITIHKSQGLTFANAIIDAGAAFASGQTYVALSRCKSLEGLVLKSRITPNSLKIDERIIEFSRKTKSANALQHQLSFAKKMYIENLFLQIFSIEKLSQKFSAFLNSHAKHFNEDNTPQWFAGVLAALHELQEIYLKFQPKIKNYFNHEISFDNNVSAQEKVSKAALYFKQHLNVVQMQLQQHPFKITNKKNADEVDEILNEILYDIALKIEQMNVLQNRNALDLIQAEILSIKFILPKINTYFNFTKTAENQVESSYKSILYKRLAELRSEIAAQEHTDLFRIASNAQLEELCMQLPQTEAQLLTVKGFGAAKTKKYGEKILEIIQFYCKENNITPQVIEVKNEMISPKKTANKTDSSRISFNLFKQGKNLMEIAFERNFTYETIVNHLIKFIQTNEIELNELLNQTQIDWMEEVYQKNEKTRSLKTLKELLGEDFSYTDIKIFLASKKTEQTL